MWVWCMVPIVLYSILDRLLLVWWYKVVPLDSILLSRTFLNWLKYAPVVLVLICGVSVFRSYSVYQQSCVSVTQSPECIQYEHNVLLSVSQMNAVAVILFIVGCSMCAGLAAIDWKLGKWIRGAMKGDYVLQDFFKCLSETHRKQWLAEIHHRQKRYDINVMSAETKELLLKKATSCKDVRTNENDLYNYDKMTHRYYK